MAAITPQSIDLTGLEDYTTAAASGGGDTFVNDGRSILVVDNGGGGAVQVTVDSLVDSSFGSDENIVVSVGAGAVAMIGPFLPQRFNALDGTVAVTYDGVTSVTVAVLALHERGW